jgi:arylsulfatase A-like enzyme
MNSDEVTLAEALLWEGYRTGYAGKWHLDGAGYPGWIWLGRSGGFEDIRYMFNNSHAKKMTEDKTGRIEAFDVWPQTNSEGICEFPQKTENTGDEKTYTTDWLADKAVDFIKENKDKPFFYVLSIPDPHEPFVVRSPYGTMFNPDDMPLPPTFSQKDAPSWLKEAHEMFAGIYGIEMGNPHREENMRKHISQYLGMVKCIDDNVGKVIKCLKNEDVFDDTIIVFTTDHGEYLGEHTMYGKGCLYDTAYNVPFIVCWKKMIAPGTVVDEFITALDFKQTMLALMGVKLTGNEEGRDASDLLMKRRKNWKNEVVVYGGDYKKFRYGLLGIFTQKFHFGVSKSSSEGLLFDQQKDPEQLNNLYEDPDYSAIIEELKMKIIRHLEKEHKSQKSYWKWICNA